MVLSDTFSKTAGIIRHEFAFTRDDFSRISRMIHQHAGICLPLSKMDMAYNRLSRRLRELGLKSFSDYLNLLERNAVEEWQHFIGALTTHLTSFFRENYHFPILAGHMQQQAAHGRVMLWSCAASTGEEPYSMAITAAETFGTLTPPVSILATDVDTGVLQKAAEGVYPMERVRDLPDTLVKRYFLRGSGANQGQVRIRPELQQLITFRPFNLLTTQWSQVDRYDAIFCRNVLIYFDRPTVEKVLMRCQQRLKPDGLFFAGHSENLNHAADLFNSCGSMVYRRRSPEVCAGTLNSDLNTGCYA